MKFLFLAGALMMMLLHGQTAHAAAVQIMSPPCHGRVVGKVAIAVTADPSVKSVNLYVDGSFLASSPPYSWAWDSRTVPNGAHTISVRAYRKHGVVLGSDSAPIMVAN